VSEAVAPRPVGAARAGLSLGVIYAFFVRAADQPIGDNHGLGGVLFEERKNLIANVGIVAHIGIFAEPTFESVGILTLVAHEGNNYLRGKVGSWPIECDRSDRIAPKSLLGLPAQPWRRRFPVLAHCCTSSPACLIRISRRGQTNHDLRPYPQTAIIRHFTAFVIGAANRTPPAARFVVAPSAERPPL